MESEGPRNDAALRERGWLELARLHPGATTSLLVCIALGAWVGYAMLSHDWSAPRRLAGGAIAGGGCWLLVMAGRIM